MEEFKTIGELVRDLINEESEKIRIILEENIFGEKEEDNDSNVYVKYKYDTTEEGKINDLFKIEIWIDKDSDWDVLKFEFKGIDTIGIDCIVEIIKITINNPADFDIANDDIGMRCPTLKFISEIEQNPVDHSNDFDAIIK